MSDYDDEDCIDGVEGSPSPAQYRGMSGAQLGAPYRRDRWGAVSWVDAGKRKPTYDPTVRWGDRQQVTLGTSSDPTTFDVLNVKLDEPMVCLVQLHARVLNGAAVVTPFIDRLVVELTVGMGSQQSIIHQVFNGLPQGGLGIDAPLDAAWPIALTNIRGRFQLFGSNAVVEAALWLSPYAL